MEVKGRACGERLFSVVFQMEPFTFAEEFNTVKNQQNDVLNTLGTKVELSLFSKKQFHVFSTHQIESIIESIIVDHLMDRWVDNLFEIYRDLH